VRESIVGLLDGVPAPIAGRFKREHRTAGVVPWGSCKTGDALADVLESPMVIKIDAAVSGVSGTASGF